MLPQDNFRKSFPPVPTRSDVEEFCSAAKNGDLATVTGFLDRHGAAIVNEQDSINARAITWAAFAGHTEIVTLLLDRGADINAHGTNGKPALTWAFDMGKTETAMVLLERGASLDEKDDSGVTPAEAARNSSNSAVAELFDNWQESRRQGILKAAEQARQKESEARAAAAERLRKLKDSQPGKFKIQPQPKRKHGPGR